jgi:hypothetical protein
MLMDFNDYSASRYLVLHAKSTISLATAVASFS